MPDQEVLDSPDHIFSDPAPGQAAIIALLDTMLARRTSVHATLGPPRTLTRVFGRTLSSLLLWLGPTTGSLRPIRTMKDCTPGLQL
jgi:hypothetical protein